MWTNEKFSYTFEAGRLHPHEMVQLSGGGCPLFFTTTFINDHGNVMAIYDCSGFAPLVTYRIEETGDVLYLLEKVLLILQQSLEYLFLPERILVTPETVFYNETTGQVRLAYVPMQDPHGEIHRNLLLLLSRLQLDLCDCFQEYLRRFAERSVRENMNLRDMLTLIGCLRRELDEKKRAPV